MRAAGVGARPGSAQLAAPLDQLERELAPQRAEGEPAALRAHLQRPLGATREIAVHLGRRVAPRGQLAPAQGVQGIVPLALRRLFAREQRLDVPARELLRQRLVAVQVDQLPPATWLERVREQVRRARLEERQEAVEPQRLRAASAESVA